MGIAGEMSEVSVQTASSLTIVEKKPQRPGGCVGIFFQLFDWNRKLSKKKLFPKKLLPQVRLRKPSKKFAGDEKQPKDRLIADENSGGFPHLKKVNGSCILDAEKNHGMRTPGLVARLMGLESMPASLQNEEKNGSLSASLGNKGNKFIEGNARFESEEPNVVEKGGTKQEVLRPQKLQKTGLSERRAVTGFGAEALQLKNVLSRSRKHHHQKLVSPVKSPRNVSGRNASRLFGAATRILEPGLQRSRSKCALTYSNEVQHPPAAEALIKETIDLEPLQNSNICLQSPAKGPSEQSSSCKNCGHLLDISDVRPIIEEKPLVSLPASHMVHPSAQVPERANPRVPVFCSQREMGWNKEDRQPHEPRRGCMDNVPDRRFLNRIGQRQLTSQQFKLQKDEFSVCSRATRRSNHGQKDISQGRERLSSRSKVSRLPSYGVSLASHTINNTKNFDVLNQTIGGNARLRMPVRVDCYRHGTDCKIVDTRHDVLSPVRKRRSVNSPRPNEGPSLVSSSLTKQTHNRCNATSGKDRGFSSHSEFGLTQLQESISGDSGKNDINAISFTFKSPTRCKTGIHADVEVRRDPNGENVGFAQKRTTTSNEMEGNRSSLKTLPISGDSLGALLEQKLKALTCQEEEDSAFGDNTPKKTTAMILQDLISALTTEIPFHQNNLPHGQQSKGNPPTIFQAKPKSIHSSNANLPISEHSPGSVLEVFFSNDSCCSTSLDDGSRCNQGVDSTECYEGPHLLEPDKDVLDSASSLGMGKFYRDSLTNLVNNISEVLSVIDHGDVHLRGSKLNHAKEVILNAELVFENAAALPDGMVNGGFSISHFVLSQLELLATVMRRNFSGLVAFHKKDGNQLKRLVFDCFIEYLESRFSRHSNSGFSAWTRLPLQMKTEMLICEIVEEVGRWVALAGLFPDELIEHEMSHFLGKWTDFELETFETGIEMDQHILQVLISEILVDFTGCC